MSVPITQEIPPLNIMRLTYSELSDFIGERLVGANDIEMVLEAFIQNSYQITETSIGSLTKSSVIRLN